MRNDFCFEGTARSVDEKTSGRGNKYWVVKLECGRDTVGFVVFKDQPIVGRMYRLSGSLTTNSRGYLQTSVNDVVQMEGHGSAPPPEPPGYAQQDYPGDDTPF
jgi:hypothetical protein